MRVIALMQTVVLSFGDGYIATAWSLLTDCNSYLGAVGGIGFWRSQACFSDDERCNFSYFAAVDTYVELFEVSSSHLSAYWVTSQLVTSQPDMSGR